jgi:truncated hemoglobin YjbI
MNLYDEAGGEAAIHQILSTFYDAVFNDVMIGFHFVKADKNRLIRVETQMTCIALGATHIKYEGKPIQKAHAPHPILGGQFERRLQLLRDAMEVHNLPNTVREAWIAHNEKLRPLVTADKGSDCDHAPVKKRLKLFGEDQ